MAATIDTIAEAGFAGASYARIAGKLGISRGLISYHFAGKDDLVKEVIHQAAEQAKAFIRPRILAEPTSPGMLRAYIQSNLAFMRDHRNNVIAMVEIAGSAEDDVSSTATLTWSMRSAPSSTCCSGYKISPERTVALSRDRGQSARTCSACGPFRTSVMSNSTHWFSSRLR